MARRLRHLRGFGGTWIGVDVVFPVSSARAGDGWGLRVFQVTGSR
jgi:hypothetical protein